MVEIAGLDCHSPGGSRRCGNGEFARAVSDWRGGDPLYPSVSHAIAYVTHLINACGALFQDNPVGRYRQVKRINYGIGGRVSAPEATLI